MEFSDVEYVARLAVDAERAGWDGFFLWDLLFDVDDPTAPVADPWVTLTAVALNTKTIRLGVMLTPLARRRPHDVARAAVTIDRLSGGRLVFGAGLGFHERDFVPFGEEFDPKVRAAKLDEALDLIARYWSGLSVTHRGAYYSADEVTLAPRPLQHPRIPVWTAAGWPRLSPLRRASRWDGVYLMSVHQLTNAYLTPDDVAAVNQYVHSLRPEGVGRFDIAVNGELDSDPVPLGEFEEAGATWWIALCPEEGLEAYRRLIRRGPPRRTVPK
jgi:alkanesulfonate monooxygenase SsuD/methylene tetrahydromethanopterin reductase-like flavin-dependent oxidoreductase (luciferase family)